MCKKMGFEPLVEAINRYRDPKTPNASKDFCLGLVVDRLYPKLKSVEVRTDQTNAQQVLINIVAGDQQVTQEQLQPQVESSMIPSRVIDVKDA